jgi:hypothetical protein
MSGGPHRIRADRLRSLPRVVPCVQRSPAVSRTAQGVRWNAPKGDGGRARPCRRRDPTASSSLHMIVSRAPLGLLARRVTHQGRRRSRHVGTGTGAATTVRRWCWRGYPFPVRGARDVHVKASAGVRVRGGGSTRAWPGMGWTQTARRRLGRRHGWWRIRRPQLGSNARGNGGWWRNTLSPVKRAALPPLCPRARGNPPRRGHGGAGDECASWRSGAREGPKDQPRLQGYGARVLGCTLREGVAVRTDARANTNTNAT